MLEAVIKMDGADAVREKLREVARRCENLSPVMRAIGDRVVRQTFERFNRGGPAPSGRPWLPPKIPNPRRRGTLRVTDQLRDSIHYQLIGHNAVSIGSNKVYAAIHQFGGRSREGWYVPARPYLGLSRENSDEILGIINEYLMRTRE